MQVRHQLLILLKNIDCGYSLEPPRLCFEQKYENYQSFSSESNPFLVVKFSIYLNRRVFVMSSSTQIYDQTIKQTQSHPSLIIWTHLVYHEFLMLYTKVQPQSFLSSGEDFSVFSVAEPFEQIVKIPSTEGHM